MSVPRFFEFFYYFYFFKKDKKFPSIKQGQILMGAGKCPGPPIFFFNL